MKSSKNKNIKNTSTLVNNYKGNKIDQACTFEEFKTKRQQIMQRLHWFVQIRKKLRKKRNVKHLRTYLDGCCGYYNASFITRAQKL